MTKFAKNRDNGEVGVARRAQCVRNAKRPNPPPTSRSKRASAIRAAGPAAPALRRLRSGFERRPDIPGSIAGQTSDSSQSEPNSRIAAAGLKIAPRTGGPGEEVWGEESQGEERDPLGAHSQCYHSRAGEERRPLLQSRLVAHGFHSGP
ncbi:hypothetical protein SKAU_G00046430 [Synaphobranchus kaupii]|uniref:Uncharacterized protein n=1 Tax=Synaphobranchus kaupii TaxID=118154 RepID=A0A9Q1G239_SYNKA|nr:hypothetical protein SKAU_G00046430 [Synaphobranchus kaupii]